MQSAQQIGSTAGAATRQSSALQLRSRRCNSAVIAARTPQSAKRVYNQRYPSAVGAATRHQSAGRATTRQSALLQSLLPLPQPHQSQPLSIAASSVAAAACITAASVANEFFEELIDIGALKLTPDDDPILGNAPLLYSKSIQPCQGTILPHMHSNGRSATIETRDKSEPLEFTRATNTTRPCLHMVVGTALRARTVRLLLDGRHSH